MTYFALRFWPLGFILCAHAFAGGAQAESLPAPVTNAPSHKEGGAAKHTADTVCAACHGPKGISVSDDYPNLAGQLHMYLTDALRAYRDKSRTAPLMNGVAAGLSDQAIDELAHYYAHMQSAQ